MRSRQLLPSTVRPVIPVVTHFARPTHAWPHPAHVPPCGQPLIGRTDERSVFSAAPVTMAGGHGLEEGFGGLLTGLTGTGTPVREERSCPGASAGEDGLPAVVLRRVPAHSRRGGAPLPGSIQLRW